MGAEKERGKPPTGAGEGSGVGKWDLWENGDLEGMEGGTALRQ